MTNTLQLNTYTYINDVKKCVEMHENMIKSIKKPETRQPYIDRLKLINEKLKPE